MRLITPLWETSERYRLAVLPMRSHLAERLVEHERILSACIDRDPRGAAVELQRHLARTANAIAGRMGVDPLFTDAEIASPQPRVLGRRVDI
jgi:DNA-binding GntR family transcriptional regulator